MRQYKMSSKTGLRGRLRSALSLGLTAALLSVSVAACSGGGGSAASTPAPTTISPPPPPPPAPAPNPTSAATETDIAYGTGLLQGGSATLLLDIYQPDGGCAAPRPFILGIHGGGFIGGSKSQDNWIEIMEAVVERGYVGLSIDYRLAGDAPLVSAEFQPLLDDLISTANSLGASVNEDILNAAAAAFEDTVTALDWARDNAVQRCLDMDQFAIWGSSAGAVTALHVGQGLDEYFIDRPDPKVIINYWGRMLIDDQLDAAGPPIMIIHGTDDQTVSYANALTLSNQAQAVGLPYSFYTIDDGPHGFSSIDPARVQINGQDPLEVTLDFIEDHFTGASPLYEVKTVSRN